MGSMIMEDTQIRNIVADEIAKTHGNLEFIRQVRNGDQDDGPWMRSAYAVRDWVMQEMAKPQHEELIDE
jgi:hypothetical protein